jgi:uncharacterized coiled-coil protein SlyX
MNNLSNATLLVLVSTLAEKVSVQELVCEGYERVNADLQTHIDRHHLDLDDMQFTISDLRRQLEEKYESMERMRTQNNELYAQVRKLQSDNYKLTYGGQTPEETANAYMARQGVEVCNRPYVSPDVLSGRIAAIKVVREITGWGLKESKDFVEAYMARLDAQKDEESPSGTKRSSQIPAGVGEQVRKSA